MLKIKIEASNAFTDEKDVVDSCEIIDSLFDSDANINAHFNLFRKVMLGIGFAECQITDYMKDFEGWDE